ncbi:MAG: T9SS type A sorting domain-containing protein, partial [Flavobacteriaceae bacterium]|nr:T9SS type A sorting domain-containing protein [Flavobacteriaceae bacterium]
FIVRELISGNPVSGLLTAGEYTVEADISSLTGYDSYDITPQPGQLIVNPSVGCNDRIKASDLCKESATLVDYPEITTRLQFTYENRLNVPIFIPLGPNNKFKGNAFRVGTPPELFLPGTHTFDVYTDGGSTQWEVKTPGCNSAFKSANGSNADPCSTSAKVDVTDFDESIVIEEGISGIYPNPVENSIVFPMHGQHTSFSIKVFNEVGMLVMQKDYPVNTYYDVTMDISMLKSGMLYFMIEKNGKREVHTILKR